MRDVQPRHVPSSGATGGRAGCALTQRLPPLLPCAALQPALGGGRCTWTLESLQQKRLSSRPRAGEKVDGEDERTGT
ncbi:hypothetical protein NDU88_001798 [Pleurodeles waltl]|uniref:Uncharacterized protein n=1 Tax=Pleurodeles waltl TaxID=8319 RepID=A0AAV7NBW1_PLEWA|nr:hypothetical protein NDU88_001798 [Pleurodeles waltl]